MHLQPFFEKYDYVGTYVSEKLFADSVSLPSDTKITDEDSQKVVEAIKKFWGVN